jgi:hypothetical protein
MVPAMSKEPKQQITRKRTSAPKVAKTPATSAPVTHDDIARRAYELFEARGYAHGFHLQDWLTAESELRG